MAKHHPKNVRIKHRYLSWLEEAKGMAPDSVNAAAAAIDLFEAANGGKDFAAFHVAQAKRFRRVLDEATNEKTGKPLATATIHARLLAVKTFFLWLADQAGYKKAIGYTDCEYFNPTLNDSRIAKARRARPVPEIGQIRRVLDNMPHETAVEKRDRAVVAFALLSGARDDAIASLNIGHVDLAARTVFQDGRMVRTKFRKSFVSSFFPVGEDIEAIVEEWIGYLRGEMGRGDDDPLFPSTLMGLGPDGGFAPVGLERRHWGDAGAIRRIFREAFEAASLRYFNPHSFRHTLARLGQKTCRTQEEEKAWSQNLGHEHVRTTQNSYGQVEERRQTEIMDGLRARPADGPPEGEPDSETIQRVVDYLSRKVGKG
jgi:integrase